MGECLFFSIFLNTVYSQPSFCFAEGYKSVCKRSRLGASGPEIRDAPSPPSLDASSQKGAPFSNLRRGTYRLASTSCLPVRQRKMVSHYCFNLHSLNCVWDRMFSPMFIRHLYFLFCELPFHVLNPNGNSFSSVQYFLFLIWSHYYSAASSSLFLAHSSCSKFSFPLPHAPLLPSSSCLNV